MQKIASFCFDHSKIGPGVYVSRVDDDIVTYDIRFIKPNVPPFLEPPVMHTIEHIFATFARNSKWGSHVVYFGPMGCRTGFYLLVKDLAEIQALEMICGALDYISNFSGEIPGATELECGNFREHDLDGAREQATKLGKTLKGWSVKMLSYPQ